jgi:YVTN family beta-propeller protein
MRLFRLTCLMSLVACGQHASTRATADGSPAASLGAQLPTGVRLDPAAPARTVGPLPLTMRRSPDGQRLVLSLGGYSEQGVQVLDAKTSRVVQDLPQAAAFVGLAFSPDGRTLYASGGNQDVVYRYDWRGDSAQLRDSLVLAWKSQRAAGKRYPAGIAASPDGAMLYVAENLVDSLAVIDLSTGEVVQRFATGAYPYDVVVDAAGTVYVSAWGGNDVSVFTQTTNGWLTAAGRIAAARHPSSLALNASGSRLYVASGSTDQVAVIDTRARTVIARLLDPPPAGPHEGATPNGLALSADGTRLFVAEADANAVGVFDLAARTADVAAAAGHDSLTGRIPVGWYPTAVMAVDSDLVVVNGKGRGSMANPGGPNPVKGRTNEYSLELIKGSVLRVPLADTRGGALVGFSARVAAANEWRDGSRRFHYPPFEHVIYVIKENRTYDEVLGDDRQGDGDSSLVFFPRPVSINHHALADRFGLFDRFFTNAEVSADGHNWSMAAYASDYVEKTIESNYSKPSRGRSYDYEGLNRGKVPEDDAAEPGSGYLWNLAERKGITFRNYGEFVVPSRDMPRDELPAGYRGNKPFLRTHTNPTYPGFNLNIRDQHRADIWIAELQDFVKSGTMPSLEIVRLPNDHTSGLTAGAPSPRAAFADNDLALGRMVEALSKSPFWKNTVMFVLEDDAQNGPDHVDAHRSELFVISPYSRGGAIHRFANTTDVLRTIEEILDLASLSQFDYYGRPLRNIWAASPDLAPYTALSPAASLDEVNPRGTRGARASAKLDFRVEDAADDDAFNLILWRAIKGDSVPYPGARRASAKDLRIER